MKSIPDLVQTQEFWFVTVICGLLINVISHLIIVYFPKAVRKIGGLKNLAVFVSMVHFIVIGGSIVYLGMVGDLFPYRTSELPNHVRIAVLAQQVLIATMPLILLATVNHSLAWLGHAFLLIGMWIFAFVVVFSIIPQKYGDFQPNIKEVLASVAMLNIPSIAFELIVGLIAFLVYLCARFLRNVFSQK